MDEKRQSTGSGRDWWERATRSKPFTFWSVMLLDPAHKLTIRNVSVVHHQINRTVPSQVSQRFDLCWGDAAQKAKQTGRCLRLQRVGYRLTGVCAVLCLDSASTNRGAVRACTSTMKSEPCCPSDSHTPCQLSCQSVMGFPVFQRWQRAS